jgi:TolA-binding protein
MPDPKAARIAQLEGRLQRMRDTLERLSDPAFHSFGDKLDAVLRDELGADEEADASEVTEALSSRILSEYDALRDPLASLTGLSAEAVGSAGSLLSRVIAGGVALTIQASHNRPEQMKKRIKRLEKKIKELKGS